MIDEGPFQNITSIFREGGFTCVLEPQDFVSTFSVAIIGKTFTVDWGDGEAVEYTNDSPYTAPSGTVTIRCNSTELFFLIDGTKNFTSMTITGGESLAQVTGLFSGLTYISSPAGISIDDTSNVWNWSSAFNGNTHWTDLSALEDWDFSAATRVGAMFSGNTSMTSVPNIDLPWGQITLANSFCQNCTSLASFPSFNMTGFTGTFHLAFSGCSSLTSFPSVDLSGVGDLYRTWYNSGLTSFPALDLSGATSIIETWDNCDSIVTFGNCDLSGVLDATSAWEGCNSMVTFSVTDMSSCTDFTTAWFGCVSMTSCAVVGSMSSGVDFTSCFHNCSAMVTFGNCATSSGTTFTSMFQGCTSLTTIGGLDTTNTAGATPTIFSGATSITAPNSSEQTQLASASGYDYN